MKKSKIILVLIISVFLIVGCNKKDNSNNESGSMSCKKEVNAPDGVKPTLTYDLTYKNGEIITLHSIEGIESDRKDKLDEYETAYRNINNNYKGLKYYNSKVTRTDNSVIRETTINYEKIDTTKLLKIEGEEDNIIENGKATLKKWKEICKKFGTVCHED